MRCGLQICLTARVFVWSLWSTVRLRFLVWSAVWLWPMCLLVVVRASGWCRRRTACLVRPRWISRSAGYIFSRRWSVLQLTWFAPSMASIASRTPHSGHISVLLSSRDSAGCPVYVCLHFGQILGSSIFFLSFNCFCYHGTPKGLLCQWYLCVSGEFSTGYLCIKNASHSDEWSASLWLTIL